MPELPEVEFGRRCLARWAGGRRLVAIHSLEEVSEDPRTAVKLAELVRQEARFARFERHGKNLFLGLEPNSASIKGAAVEPVWLWSHLGMTGKWLRRAQDEPPPRFSRASLHLDNGETLHFCDLRRFGALETLSEEERRTQPTLASLGPDLLDRKLTAAVFAARLQGRKLAIKPLLLDQTRVAGVGNIQAAEGLFRARLDPHLTADELGPEGLGRLLEELRASCRATLAAFGREARRGSEITYVEESPEANPFLVYGREGEPCSRCRAPIQRFTQAGRSTFFCPSCQTSGRRKPPRAKAGLKEAKEGQARVRPGARRVDGRTKLPRARQRQ